jgi:catechol 2,3-dioxygenase-like lactoylglutathione lyase family enzyme
MNQSIVHMTLVVEDYGDAIRFYTEKPGFDLVDDTPQTEEKKAE